MSTPATDRGTAARMHAIAAALVAADLTAQVHDTRGVLDVTARLDLPGRTQIEVICDDDGYTQVSYWNSPDATAAQVTATIAAVLAAITTET
jgi:hypothetical protein